MKIRKKDLMNLIRESLKSTHFGTRDKEGKLAFAPDLKDMESVYGKNIGGKVSKQKLEEFFKDSIIPFNVITIPDDAYRTLQNMIVGGGGATFEQVELNFFEKALTSITSMFRGRYDDLAAIRSKIDPDAYNIMIERKDEDYGAFFFDLTWVAHDLIGHGINLEGVGDYGMLVSGIGGLFNAIFHLPVPSKFTSGTKFDQDLKIDDNRVFSDVTDNTVISAIKADLERENFTPGVGKVDIAASVLGYYFIKGRFPSIIYDLAAEGTLDINKINQYESDFKKMVESLKGKVGMFRFGDNMKYLEI
jgi:hypothetical protein